jgi:hypothetical protein
LKEPDVPQVRFEPNVPAASVGAVITARPFYLAADFATFWPGLKAAVFAIRISSFSLSPEEFHPVVFNP